MASAIRACVYDVPMALDSTFSHTRGLDPSSAIARNDQHLHDCVEHLLGSMPPRQFLNFFLPADAPRGRKRRLQSRNAFKHVPSSCTSIDDMYPTWQTAKQARCPGFVFEIAATRSLHPKRPGHTKPHICCYASEFADIIRSSDPSSPIELGHAELFIDLKPHRLHDFFVDPPSNLSQDAHRFHEFLQLAQDEDGQPILDLSRTLGQHVAFVTEILARQFRTFLFSISMSGSFARILRWDRSGCVATQAFDIREHPDLLCEFLWRFSQTSNEGRGHDPTVQLASPEEQTLFRNVVTDAVRVQLDDSDANVEDAVREHYAPGRVYALDILRPASAGNTSATRRYLVSRPVISPLSFVGRGTRGYWAVDVVASRIAFLKDTWRFGSVDELEADTLQRLQSLEVRHIPRVAWYGDVCDNDITSSPQQPCDIEFQETSTNKVRQASWVCQVNGYRVRISRRRHHRLVLETVGYGLSRLHGTAELLSACYDVFTAMQDARKKDSRIHRDISLGNIILVKVSDDLPRQGYLIDWEASCTVDGVGEAVEVGRAGTWRFMSMRMLNFDGDKLKHTFQDDMEALFYVVLFCALMYLDHDCSLRHIKSILQNFFDEKMPFKPGIVRGGTGKRLNSKCRAFTKGIEYQSPHLGEWLDTVADFLRPADHDDSSSDENSIVDGSREEPQDRWSDPKHLDIYWRTFLQTHALEKKNRSVYRLPSHAEDETPSPLIFPTPPSSPLPLSNCGSRTSRKRPSHGSNDDACDTKRARLSGPGMPGSTGARRSARLEEKMKREAQEREAQEKRKDREAQAAQDKSKVTKQSRKRAVGTARGGPVSTRSTRKNHGASGS